MNYRIMNVFLLRTVYAYIQFTEEEKINISEEEKKKFIYKSKNELTPTEKKLANMTIREQIEYLFGNQSKS